MRFEEVDARPSVPVRELSSDLRAVVDRLVRHKREFMAALHDPESNELRRFWLRKTRKPVLAVLRLRDGSMFCGLNVEVSMPTGSLCSERNVIGTALASRPGLARTDFLAVAVLAVNMDEGQGERNPMHPCGACLEWLRKIAELNPAFLVLTFESQDCRRVFASEVS